MHHLKRLLAPGLALLAGLLQAFSQPGVGPGVLAWVSFIPLLWAIDGKKPLQALGLGWLAGMVAYIVGTHWLVGSIVDYNGMTLPAAIGTLIGCSAAHALRTGIMAGAASFAQKRGWPLWLGLALAVPAGEHLLPYVLPYTTAVTQRSFLPALQILEITGIHGLVVLIVLANGALYGLAKREWKLAAGVAPVLALVLGWGAWRMNHLPQSDDVVRIGLVQHGFGGDFPKSERQAALETLQGLTQQAVDDGAELVIWPEAANQASIQRDSKLVSPKIVGRPGIYQLIGTRSHRQLTPDTRDKFNTVMLVRPDSVIVGAYDKRVLMAFGEYLPLSRKWPGLNKAIGIYNLAAGDSVESLVMGDHRIGVSICYEAFFPGPTRDLFQLDADPHVIVSVSNDSWHGEGAEQDFALSMTALRAVEHRRWLARPTTTGWTAFVDSAGRIVERGPHKAEGVLVQDVPMLTGRTMYARFGDWLVFVLLAGVVFLWIAPAPGADAAPQEE
jgi:apolipoprotein N-acyltransferase